MVISSLLLLSCLIDFCCCRCCFPSVIFHYGPLSFSVFLLCSLFSSAFPPFSPCFRHFTHLKRVLCVRLSRKPDLCKPSRGNRIESNPILQSEMRALGTCPPRMSVAQIPLIHRPLKRGSSLPPSHCARDTYRKMSLIYLFLHTNLVCLPSLSIPLHDHEWHFKFPSWGAYQFSQRNVGRISQLNLRSWLVIILYCIKY